MLQNKITLIGNLTKDAELNKFLTLSIAVENRFAKDRDADFFYLKGFGDRWNKLAEYLTKGTKVAIEAHLSNNNFETEDGYTEFRNDIVIDEIVLLGSPRKDEDESSKLVSKRKYKSHARK